YALLVLPITFLIVKKSPTPVQKLCTLFASFLLTSAIIFSTLFPINGAIRLFTQQAGTFALIFIAGAIAIGLSYVRVSALRWLHPRGVKRNPSSLSERSESKGLWPSTSHDPLHGDSGKIILLSAICPLLVAIAIYPAFRTFLWTESLIAFSA